MQDLADVDDWKQITTNLAIAEGQVFGFDTLIERLRLRINTRIWVVSALFVTLLLGLVLQLASSLLASIKLASIPVMPTLPMAEFLPAMSVLLIFVMVASFMQMQKMRELLAEANLARATHASARRRVLARNLGGGRIS